MTDPYAGIAAPVAAAPPSFAPSDDPYAAVAAPVSDSAPMHTFSTRTKSGKTISFQAPADADDATIRSMAAKATGSRAYLQSAVKRDGTPLPQTDKSALNALALGVLKPVDTLAGLLDKVPGLHEASDAIGRVTGLGTAAETNAQHDAERQNNSRAGYQTLGNIAGTLPLAAIPGAATAPGLGLTGMAGGALLSNAKDARELAFDAGLGGAGGMIGGKVIAPALRYLASGAAGVSRYAAQRVTNFARPAAEVAADSAAPAVMAPKAVPILLKTLAKQDGGVEGSLSRVQAARARGVPLALMDSGDEARGLASSLARAPGESRTTIRGAVIPRQDAQIDRVQDAITSNLGPAANVRQASEQLMKGAREAAAPLYDEAYAAPVVTSERLEQLLNTPAGRQALTRAHVIAANEGRAPAEMGLMMEADGSVRLNPQPGRQMADHLGARDELTAAQEAYRAAKATPGASVAKARDRVVAARDNLRRAEIDVANAPDPTQAASVPGYTTQTLDYVKRGLDDVVEAFRDKTTGRLVLDEGGRAINSVRHGFVSEVDKLNPAYSAARAAFAGPARMNTALQKGASFANKDAETLAAETADLTPAEMEQYKLGVRSALVKQLDARVDGADKVKALIGSPKKRKALENLFGGGAGFERFMATLGDEGQAAATYARVNAGSQTAANLADDAHLSGLSGVAVNAGERALRGTGLVHNAISTLADLYRYGAGEAGARVRADLARTISNMDPRELEAFEQAAKDLEARRLASAAQGARIQGVGGQASVALLPRGSR